MLSGTELTIMRIATAAFRAAFFVSAVAALSSISAAALAGNCARRENVVAALAKHHGEIPVVRAIVDQIKILEIFTSKGGKTWSVVVTRADGLSCLMASGQNWQAVPARPVLKGKQT
jgi:hypothetical protein